MRTLTVALEPPYPVHIGVGALPHVAEAMPEQRVALLADETVYALHGAAVTEVLTASGKTLSVHTFPPGEASKSLGVYAGLLSDLARTGVDRSSAVVALGGGVAGDLAGFVAATYLRGLAFYQLPSTLLAMVDSSVGGKTGVNLSEGKNLVGAFHQPRAVGADPRLLATLSERTFREGAVELFKAGLLADPGILDELTKPGFAPGGDPGLLSELIARGVKVKADIVAEDETETGVRAHLNLGHTLGHALESASRHAIGHGDAVAYGLLYAAQLAHQRGHADLRGAVQGFLGWLGPVPFPSLTLDELAPYLLRDKKAQAGVNRFVLLRDAGDPVLVNDLSQDELRAAWDALPGLLR